MIFICYLIFLAGNVRSCCLHLLYGKYLFVCGSGPTQFLVDPTGVLLGVRGKKTPYCELLLDHASICMGSTWSGPSNTAQVKEVFRFSLCHCNWFHPFPWPDLSADCLPPQKTPISPSQALFWPAWACTSLPLLDSGSVPQSNCSFMYSLSSS